MTYDAVNINIFHQAYPSGPDPLESADKMEYYGQRPWRPGKVALEPTDMELEQAGIQALLHREKNNSEHSKEIIDLLEKSISQFRHGIKSDIRHKKMNMFASRRLGIKLLFLSQGFPVSPKRVAPDGDDGGGVEERREVPRGSGAAAAGDGALQTRTVAPPPRRRTLSGTEVRLPPR